MRKVGRFSLTLSLPSPSPLRSLPHQCFHLSSHCHGSHQADSAEINRWQSSSFPPHPTPAPAPAKERSNHRRRTGILFLIPASLPSRIWGWVLCGDFMSFSVLFFRPPSLSSVHQFAFSSDREKSLSNLLPGTSEHQYYSLIHLLNTDEERERKEEAMSLLKAFKESAKKGDQRVVQMESRYFHSSRPLVASPSLYSFSRSSVDPLPCPSLCPLVHCSLSC